MRWLFNSTSCSRAVAIALRASSRVITHSILCAVIVGCCIVLCCNLSSTRCCCTCQRAVAGFVNVLLLLSSTCCCCSSTCCCYVAPFVVMSLCVPSIFRSHLFCSANARGGVRNGERGPFISGPLQRSVLCEPVFNQTQLTWVVVTFSKLN